MKDSSTAPPPVPCRLHHGAPKCHHNRKINRDSNVKTIWNHNRKWKTIVAHFDSPLGELSSGAECLDLRNWWAAQCASLMESTGPKRRLHPPTANARQMVTWEYTRRLCLAPCCCETMWNRIFKWSCQKVASNLNHMHAVEIHMSPKSWYCRLAAMFMLGNIETSWGNKIR